jgi:hypothetical protein
VFQSIRQDHLRPRPSLITGGEAGSARARSFMEIGQKDLGQMPGVELVFSCISARVSGSYIHCQCPTVEILPYSKSKASK